MIFFHGFSSHPIPFSYLFPFSLNICCVYCVKSVSYLLISRLMCSMLSFFVFPSSMMKEAIHFFGYSFLDFVVNVSVVQIIKKKCTIC